MGEARRYHITMDREHGSKSNIRIAVEITGHRDGADETALKELAGSCRGRVNSSKTSGTSCLTGFPRTTEPDTTSLSDAVD